VGDGVAAAMSVPVPVVKIDKMIADKGETITFDASESFSVSGNPIVDYRWEFYDEMYDWVRDEEVVERKFYYPGTYFGNLVAIDSDGNESQLPFHFFIDTGLKTPAQTDVVAISEGFSAYFDTSTIAMRGLVDPTQMYWKLDPNSEDLVTGRWANLELEGGGVPGKTTASREVQVSTIDVFGNRAVATREITLGDEILSPIANWDALESGSPSDMFQLDATISENTDSTTQIRWGFADGSPFIEGLFSLYSLIEKSFSGRNGLYVTWLNLQNSMGLGSSYSLLFNISDGVRPSPAFTVSEVVGFMPFTITMDSSSSTAGDDPIVERYWGINEGDFHGARTGLTATHTFNRSAGWKRVRLKLTDEEGRTAKTAWKNIYVVNPYDIPAGNEDPVAAISIESQIDSTVVFDGTSTDDTNVMVYEWDFGNGKTAVGRENPMMTYVYTAPGTYTVTLKVTDEHGASDQTDIPITVSIGSANAPPLSEIQMPDLEIDGGSSPQEHAARFKKQISNLKQKKCHRVGGRLSCQSILPAATGKW
jgi:PKD repeat protein